MNAFDFSILSALNHFADQHPLVNEVVLAVNEIAFLKSGTLIALFCWAWFKNGEDIEKNRQAREVVISAMVACFIAIILTRLAVLALPFRIRPLSDPANGLHFPPDTFGFQGWSSFPSDHAIMFFALTTCLFSISRFLGWIALLHSLLVACLPRVYLGIHYPTDILAGAIIGVGIGLLANQKTMKILVVKYPFRWMQKYPGPFYAIFFLVLYEVAASFWDLRYVELAAKWFLKHT